MAATIQNSHAGEVREALLRFAASPQGLALAGDYLHLLERIDVAFASHTEGDPTRTICRPTCSACCRGLFEITILDALLLTVALKDSLIPQDAQQAAARLSEQVAAAGWEAPHFWGSWKDATSLDFLDEAPCPLLDESELCRVYASRPSVCRFQGLVFADPRGDLVLEDDCPKRDSAPPPALLDLHGFYAEEDECYGRLLAALPVLKGLAMESWDTFVGGVIAWSAQTGEGAG